MAYILQLFSPARNPPVPDGTKTVQNSLTECTFPRFPSRVRAVSPAMTAIRRRHAATLCYPSTTSLGDGIIIPRPAIKRISPLSHVCRTKIARKLQIGWGSKGDGQPLGFSRHGGIVKWELYRDNPSTASGPPPFTQGRLT